MPDFFRKKGQQDKTANGQSRWQEDGGTESEWEENPLYQGKTEDAQTTAAPVPLDTLYGELAASKKGGLFKRNSDYYNAVSDSLVHVLSLLADSISEDVSKRGENFNKLIEAYKRLLEACGKYCARRSYTDNGQARQEVVGRIKEQAQADLEKLIVYFEQYSQLPESERATSARDALQLMRRKKLELRKADSEHAHVGGAASRLTVLEEGDLKDSMESGFYKAEDVFTGQMDKRRVVLEAMERARGTKPIEDSLYEKTREGMANLRCIDLGSCLEALDNMEETSSVPEFFDYVQEVKKICTGIDVTEEQVTARHALNLPVRQEEKRNMSNRNVATSRVAEVLGLGDIVARSETVELVEPGKKKGRIGNLMQKAEGQEAAAIVDRYKEEAVLAHRASGKAEDEPIGDSGMLSGRVTGTFQKQLAGLQVLDYLTGQVDRHTHNYMIQQDEQGNFTGLTAIDNDFSFGNAEIGAGNTMGAHGRSVVDKEGKLIIPHMEAALAERICALTTGQLTLLLADLIEPDAIGFACKRLETLKKAITDKKAEENAAREALKQAGAGQNGEEAEKFRSVFLGSEEEAWTEETMQDFRSQKGGITGNDANYLSIFLNNESGKEIEYYREDMQKQEYAQTVWEDAAARGEFDTPERMLQFLLPLLPGCEKELGIMKIRGALRKDLTLEKLPAHLRERFIGITYSRMINEKIQAERAALEK